MDPNRVKSVMVVGAGVMGHSIAQVFAQAGVEVYLMDVRQDVLDYAKEKIISNLKILTQFGKAPVDDEATILSRIHMTTDLSQAAKEVAFAIEVVVEKPEIKKNVFAELEKVCPDDLVLASNTSSLDIYDIVKLKSPERLVVAHWFAPAYIIPLVEVVPGPETDPKAVRFTAGLMERIGKRPLVMKKFINSFIVNRFQKAMSEVVWELIENDCATPEEIDLAIKLSLGIRLPVVGVIQTADFSGLDLVYDIHQTQNRVVPLIEEKVKQGHLGAKTGKGLYDYSGRSEREILEKRDLLYLKVLESLEEIGAFEPV